MRGLLRRSQVWVLIAASGGSLFLLEGCDPAVRTTVLTGVGNAMTSLSATFIEAFIQSLTTKADSDDQTPTTVRANTDIAHDIFV